MSRQPPPDRSLARALALQGLYQWRVGGADEAAIEAHLADLVSSASERDVGSEPHGREPRRQRREADMALCRAILGGVIREHQTLTEQLVRVLDRPFSELSPVEASLLLMATWELAHCPETPYRVVLNEAIELAKRFGSNDGHRYVNGVLDKVAASLRLPEMTAEKSKRESNGKATGTTTTT